MSQLGLVFDSDFNQTVQSQSIPEPIEGFVQVRVEAAAFNPLDYKIHDRYRGFVQKFPTILGVDAAGEVTKLGPGVTKFKVGDRVTCLCTPNSPPGVGAGERGAFQQYALADVRVTSKILANADYDSAASFPVAGNTAAGALYGQLKFTHPWLGGEGATSVGAYIAVLSGLESLGAATVIDRSAPDVAAQILAAAAGPVKYVVDCVALPETQLLGTAAEAKELTLLGTNGPQNFYFSERFWDEVGGYMERGVIKFNRTAVLSGGLRSWEKGKVSGTKIIMRPQETKFEK
ncbi:chaperonin 10-like protein [Mycena galopus ATCC 62051]|nr:chaperonin 10-like protein [Mycena galopus ATCC 62051]